jgi:hypothetical protein
MTNPAFKIAASFMLALLVGGTSILHAVAQTKPAHFRRSPQSQEWHFAVSGDSRNCGDIVMPTIAQSVNHSGSQFYWHLGDFRAIYDFDQDMQLRPRPRPLLIIEYEGQAWDDFIENQITPFTVPVFLGIGNHETISPKTRGEYLVQFADWLNAPVIKEQRLRDDPKDHKLKSYYHWMQGGVDFIYLDNATTDQFDTDQLNWVEKVLKRDAADPSVKTVVVGMHESLPDSLASDHSMGDYPNGVQSGRQLYADLLALQKSSNKRVYVLASHSHFYMEGIFDSEYWRTHGGVLPGWIIGTAGAVRYKLPPNANLAKAARTNVYGYLFATVNPKGEPEGSIRFEFRELLETDVPADTLKLMGTDLVHQCFIKNSQAQ